MKILGVIPARSGSERVRGKNLRRLGNHSLLEIAVKQAKRLSFLDAVVVTSDNSEYLQLAEQFDGVKTVLRPSSISGPENTDFEWLAHLDRAGMLDTDVFVILRPTSPFRSDELVRRALELLANNQGWDSIRTLTLVSEHPGKMWSMGPGGTATPFIKEKIGGKFQHALQYKSLPKVYVQTSVLEVARKHVLELGSREGNVIGGLVTEGPDSLAIDTELDFLLHQALLERFSSLTTGIHEDYQL